MISSHSRLNLFVEYVNKSHKSFPKFGRSLIFWNFLQKTIPPIYRNGGSIIYLYYYRKYKKLCGLLLTFKTL
jgi:hypothetical protein